MWAIDYDPPHERTGTEVTSFDSVVGSQRIEDIVLRDAPRAMRRSSPVITILGPNRLDFTGIRFEGPFRLKGDDIIVFFDRCAFTWGPFSAGGWFLGTARLEVYSDRSSANWTSGKAVARGTEEVLAALYELRRSEQKGVSLSKYYAEVRQNAVLILGSYSDSGLARLRTLAAAVRALGYEPVLIMDVPDLPAQTLAQKVVMIGSLSWLVIVDDTEKSGHLTEIELCRVNQWITVVLRQDGRPSSAMSAGMSVTSNVILEKSYAAGDITDPLNESLRWAESKREEVGQGLTPHYPWAKTTD